MNILEHADAATVTKPLGKSEQLHGVPPEDGLRARLYALLSSLLAAPPSAEALQALGTLDGDETDMGQAVTKLAEAAAETTPEAVEREYQNLFIGVTHGELTPFASYYLTGFLQERPLADLRSEMASLGIARAEASPEPEDHIASLLEIMHGLITGAFGEPADLDAQRHFFDTHIASWASRLFVDMEAAKNARFYVLVGVIGRLFMEIENRAFRMAA